MKSIALLGCLLASPFLLADSLILKNGQELRGDIVQDGPDGVLIDYYVTATIKDQKLVPREEIVRIDALTADEKAFREIGPLSTPPTVTDTSFYDALLEKKIPAFLSKYPYSKHLPQLRQKLDSLKAERSRVLEGDRKIDGTWLTASEIQADPYQTTAMLRLAALRERIQANDPAGALQIYELLEKSFPGSKVMPEAVDAAIAQIDLLEDRISKAKAEFEVIDKKRQRALALAQADEAQQIREAMEKNAALVKSAVASAQLDGSKFYPVFPDNKDALDSLQTLGVAEKTRLMLLQKTPMRDGITAAKAASEALAAGNLSRAQEQLDLSQKCWPLNVDNQRLKEQIDAEVKKRAAAAAAAQQQQQQSPKK